jgi:hypothetical protein
MAEQQGQFDIEPIVGDRLTPPYPSAHHSVRHGVEMQGELLGGKRITHAAVEKHSKCFPKPRIAFGVGGQTSQHLGDPGTGILDISAHQRRGHEPRITIQPRYLLVRRNDKIGELALLPLLQPHTGDPGDSVRVADRRQRAAGFKKFLVIIDKTVPAQLDVHLICDNLPPTKPLLSRIGWPSIRASMCISPRQGRPGSTK